MNIPYDAASNEAVSQRNEVRILFGIFDAHIGQLDVEVLINRLQLTGDGDIVLELDADCGLLVHEALEKLEE